MQLTDKFQFGQYMSLTLQEVYQGTATIDKVLLKNFLNNCLNDIEVPKPSQFELCDLLLTEDEIVLIPQVFNEEKPESLSNVVSLGNLSKELGYYFTSFFQKNWYGIVENLEKFNKNSNNKKVIGGDPEYIKWCMKTINGFTIDNDTKRQLEILEVNRLLGISLRQTSTDKYSYQPIIKKEFSKFS